MVSERRQKRKMEEKNTVGSNREERI